MITRITTAVSVSILLALTACQPDPPPPAKFYLIAYEGLLTNGSVLRGNVTLEAPKVTISHLSTVAQGLQSSNSALQTNTVIINNIMEISK